MTGRELRERRIAAGVTARELAAAMQVSGSAVYYMEQVDKSREVTVQRYETGLTSALEVQGRPPLAPRGLVYATENIYCSRTVALVELEQGANVWVECDGGLVEGQLAEMGTDTGGCYVDWNWGPRRKVVHQLKAAAALELAEQLVTGGRK